MFITLPAMEKPPEVPAKTEAASKEAATYFSLLPADVRNIVFNFLTNVQGDTDFDRLDNAIANLRNFMEADPPLKEKLLNDAEFNEQLIKMVAERFGIHQSEVALMLNTPASLNFLKNLTEWVPKPKVGLYGFGRWWDSQWWRSVMYYAIKSDKERQMVELKSYGLLKDRFFNYLNQMRDQCWKKRAGMAMPAKRVPGCLQEAIRYVKRYAMHPLFAEIFESDDLYLILVAIDSIAHGLDDFRKRYDGNEDASQPYRNAQTTQDYINIAIALNDQRSLEWVKDMLQNPGESTGDIVLRKFFERLDSAFKEKNKTNIDFMLQVLLTIPERVKKNFNKEFIEAYDRYTPVVKFEDFLNDIIAYLESTQDYKALEILSSLIDDQITKKIITSMLIRAPFNEPATEPFIKKLITLGADINGKDDNGSTVLINAVVQGKPDLVRILLQISGIDVNAYDNYGNNALWYAQNASMNLAVRQEIIDLLKSAGAQEREVCTGL